MCGLISVSGLIWTTWLRLMHLRMLRRPVGGSGLSGHRIVCHGLDDGLKVGGCAAWLACCWVHGVRWLGVASERRWMCHWLGITSERRWMCHWLGITSERRWRSKWLGIASERRWRSKWLGVASVRGWWPLRTRRLRTRGLRTRGWGRRRSLHDPVL
jgi:hypothetical protein